MSSRVTPIGNKWYYTLKDNSNNSKYKTSSALFNSIPRNLAYTYFIVYKVVDQRRLYAAFNSSVDFFYFYKYEPHNKEYHEVILGEKQQKARFDIDIPYENYVKLSHMRGMIVKDATEISVEWMIRMGNRLVSKIIDAIIQVMNGFNIKIDVSKDIAFYNSHSLEMEPYKYSAHIILPNYCHFNYEEAKEFYKMVVNCDDILQFSEKAGLLDGSIYSSLKSFRMVESTKSGLRPKIRAPLPYKGVIYDPPIAQNKAEVIDIFRESCITDCTSTDRIPVILPEKEVFVSKVKLPPQTESILIPFLGDDFSIIEVKGGLILLKRLRPSYCQLCHREHEAENPYLTVKENGDVYFHCRRAISERSKYQICHVDGVVELKHDSETNNDNIEGNDTQKLTIEPKKKRPTVKREGINFKQMDMISSSNSGIEPSKKVSHRNKKNKQSSPWYSDTILPKEFM